MTILADVPVIAPVVPPAPSHPHAAQRFARDIARGWHILVDGEWLLVESVVRRSGVVSVATAGAPAQVLTSSLRWTRMPAEQVAFVSSLFPSQGALRSLPGFYEPVAGHMANPFEGSSPSPLGGVR
jgi:hypothetical protein